LRISLVSILLLLALFVPFPTFAIGYEPGSSPVLEKMWLVLWLEPAEIIFGPDYCVGETFTVACKIDHNNLHSFGLTLAWNTTYLEYVDHVMTVPVEEYPGGIMYGPVLIVADVVNEAQGIYDCAASMMGGGPFNRSGTAFEITFRVKDQPMPPEADVYFWIRFNLVDIWPDLGPMGIYPELTEESRVIIHTYEEPPPSPPVGGTSVSIDSGKFSSWVTATLLLAFGVITSGVKWKCKRKKN